MENWNVANDRIGTVNFFGPHWGESSATRKMARAFRKNFFRVCLLVYGMDSRNPDVKSETVKTLHAVLRVFLILYSILRAVTVWALVSERSRLSCGELAVIVNHLISIGVAFRVLKSYENVKLHGLVKKYLVEEIPLLLNFVLIFCCLTLYAVLSFTRNIGILELTLRAVCPPVYALLLAFMVLYKRLVTTLCGAQRDILAQVKTCNQPRFSEENIRRQKHEIRDVIQSVNEHCGANLTMLCLKLSLGVSFTAESLFHRKVDYAFLVNNLMIQGSYLMLMAQICYRGSELLALIDMTEQTLCRKKRLHGGTFDIDELRRYLEFKANWDSLEMTGGFRVEIPTLMSFMKTCFTITAIIIQFDYRTIATLQSAVEAFHVETRANN